MKKSIIFSSITILSLILSSATVYAAEVILSNNPAIENKDSEQASYYYREDDIYYAPSEVNDYKWNDYNTPEGKYELSDLLEKLCLQNPEGKFAVKFRFFKPESKNVVNFLLTESSGEIERLSRENIKSRLVTINGELMMYSVLSAEQIINFPANGKYGYQMSLSENMYGLTSIISIEKAETLLEILKDNYYHGEDGIYYSASGVDDLYSDAEERYFPPKGTYEITNTLLALCLRYPEEKFAVQLECQNSIEETEIERLNNNEIKTVKTTKNPGRLYAVMTSEQLKSFPVNENNGYIIGLAEKSEEILLIRESEMLLGDINADGKTDVTDLTELSLALIGDTELTVTQQKAADVDGDGAVKLTDLAKFRQYLSKVISSFKD